MSLTNNGTNIAGRGRKRPQLDIPFERLHLDRQNPRLPEEWQGKDELELIRVLYEQFNLDELAESLDKNGYFDEEPLIATPHDLPDDLAQVSDSSVAARYKSFIESETTEFIVVEGNRRLATVKLLLNSEIRRQVKVARDFPQVSEAVAEDLKVLPVIIYPHRDEVVPYLGVRHIIGIVKWDPYAKARYLAKMIESGSTVEQVQDQIGDTQNAVLKSYVSYKLLEQARDEFNYDTRAAKNNFSLLMLALNQPSIKEFLGLPRRLQDVSFDLPVPSQNVENLESLLTWVFGNKQKQKIITDSRQITQHLRHIVASPEAVVELKRTNNLLEAYDRTSGEEQILLKRLSDANRNLEFALGVSTRHKTDEVIDLVERCAKTATTLQEIVSKRDD